MRRKIRLPLAALLLSSACAREAPPPASNAADASPPEKADADAGEPEPDMTPEGHPTPEAPEQAQVVLTNGEPIRPGLSRAVPYWDGERPLLERITVQP